VHARGGGLVRGRGIVQDDGLRGGRARGGARGSARGRLPGAACQELARREARQEGRASCAHPVLFFRQGDADLAQHARVRREAGQPPGPARVVGMWARGGARRARAAGGGARGLTWVCVAPASRRRAARRGSRAAAPG
jgi:hypothetical protein